MINSKLIQIYTSLNKEEKTMFKKWVRSPLHNQNDDVTRLFLFIEQKRKLTERVIKKEKVFNFIYPEASYDDLRMRHLMNLGVGLLENFVCFFMQKKERIANRRHLMTFYKERNLGKYLEQDIAKVRQSLDVLELEKLKSYADCYELEVEIFEYISAKNRISAFNIEEVLWSQKVFVIISTLKNACMLLYLQIFNPMEKKTPVFLEAVLEEIKSGAYNDVLLVQFYFYSYNCSKEDADSRCFFELKAFLMQNANKLGREELRIGVYIGVNYYIKSNNRETILEENPLLKEAFELYKFGLEHKLFLKGNHLAKFIYNIIINIAIELSELDWCHTFSEAYACFLDPKDRAICLAFAKARLFHREKKYDEALILLNQHLIDEQYLNIDFRMLQIKIYFETKMYDLMEANLNNLATYIQRHQQRNAYGMEEYKKTVYFMRKLLYAQGLSREKINKLKKEFQSSNIVISRIWFWKQLNAL